MKGSSQSAQIISSVLHSKTAIRLLPPSLRDIALRSYAHSLSFVWVGCGLVGMITLASAYFIQEKEMGPVKARWRKGERKNVGATGMGVVPPDGMA
jgi:hypothetical protein